MTIDEFLERLRSRLLPDNASIDALALGDRMRIQTVNLHHLALALSDVTFGRTVMRADYITADGWPIVVLARSQGVMAERVTGSEWIARMLATGGFTGRRIALIGGTPSNAGTFGKLVEQGGGSLVFSDSRDYSDGLPPQLVTELLASGSDVALVAVSPPRGDEIAAMLLTEGFEGTTLNVGGSIDMLVGVQSPAPTLVKRLGMEWFYRLAKDPRRLWHRYIVMCLPVYLRWVLPAQIRAAYGRRERAR